MRKQSEDAIFKPVTAPLKLFYSYAQEDETFVTNLEKHLSLLRREGMITTWSHREIVPGSSMTYETDRYLDSASLIILLISPDFMSSDYCYSLEMAHALDKHKHGKARVIPLLLRPVDWQSAPFAHLQCLPTNLKPVTTWSNEDEAFMAIAEGLRNSIHALSSTNDISSASTPNVATSNAGEEKKTQVTQAIQIDTPVKSARLLYTYDAHADNVLTVAWSPDGTRIASAGLDKTIHIWEASTGHHLLTYRGHVRRFPPTAIYVVRWSPDSTHIASAGKATAIHVWNPANGQRVALYEGHSNLLSSIYRLAWSPHGQCIASANMDAPFLDEALHIWNATNRQKLLKIDLRQAFLKASWPGGISWSPDGQIIAASCEKTIQLFQAVTGKHILMFDGHDRWVELVVWSPDGKCIASVAGDKIILWEPTTCKILCTYIVHNGPIRDMAWSPDGKYLASASEDKTVQIWEPGNGRRLLTYTNHTNHVTALAWSPDCTRIASASTDNTVHIWRTLPYD